jgi:hypothetical protein
VQSAKADITSFEPRLQSPGGGPSRDGTAPAPERMKPPQRLRKALQTAQGFTCERQTAGAVRDGGLRASPAAISIAHRGFTCERRTPDGTPFAPERQKHGATPAPALTPPPPAA